MAFADTQKLIVELDLKGNFKSGLRSAQSDLKSFDKATSRTQKSLGKFGSNIGKGIAIGAGAIATGAAIVVHAASDYEDAFAGVRKTVDATEPQLQELSDAFRDLSKQIPISAAELARLGEAGGALGIPVQDLEEFVRVTALLGQTTNLTADEAANSLGILTNVLHLTSAEYSQFASALVALGNAGASTEADIIAIAERAGAAGELIGLTSEQVLAMASSVASLGIEAEAGGTALQNFFIGSTKAIAEGGDELKLFAKVTGKSAKDFKRAFEKDAGGALQDFLKGLGKLDQAAQLNVLEELGFGDARITRTLLGLANNTELVASQQEVANKAFKENTALTKEAEQRNKTFASQLGITKNVLTDIAITIGSKLLPKLTPLLQQFNKFVSDNEGKIEAFGDDVAAGFTTIADGLAKVDWQPFIDGLKITAEVAKGAVAAFQSMPDWLQKLVIAGAVVNKVSGGLVTSIGKDLGAAIGGALFDKFLARGSSAANPLWVQPVGGGLSPTGPMGPLGGPGGGLLGKLVKGALGFTIVVAAADIANTLEGPLQDFAENVHKDIFGDWKLSPADLSWPFGPKNTPTILPEVFGGNGALGGNAAPPKLGGKIDTQNLQAQKLDGLLDRQREANATAQSILSAVHNSTSQEVAIGARNQAAAFAIRDKVAQDTSIIGGAINAAKAEIAATKAAAAHAGQQAAAAIRDKDLSVTVNPTPVNVTVRNIVKQTNLYKSIYRTVS